MQSFMAAPPEAVWAALFARQDLLFDGLPPDGWPEGREEHPPLHVAIAWPWTEPAGAATRAALTLHAMGGGTRLDVRHEGWGDGPAWDAAIQGHFAGWLQGIAALGHALETGGDPRASTPALAEAERYFISGEVPAAPAAVFRALTDAAVLARWAGGGFAGFTVTESVDDRLVRWSTPAGGELVAILRATPRGVHVALAEYGVADRSASARWPGMFEALARFLG